MDDSLRTSRRAAKRHTIAIATGAPRSARWVGPSAVLSALGAAIAAPLLRPAALALGALAVLLLAVHREDRRNAWRYVPEQVTPARFLPPLRPAQQQPVIELGLTAEPAPPVVKAVHVPTQPVPLPALPRPRVADERPRGGEVHAPVRLP